jgi:hypothetical protein
MSNQPGADTDGHQITCSFALAGDPVFLEPRSRWASRECREDRECDSRRPLPPALLRCRRRRRTPDRNGLKRYLDRSIAIGRIHQKNHGRSAEGSRRKNRIEVCFSPPARLVAYAMEGAVMRPAEPDDEFIAMREIRRSLYGLLNFAYKPT